MALDLTADPVALTAALVDIESVSGDEAFLADEVQAALTALGRFEVVRDGNVVLARTSFGLGRRVVLAGHLDTVPIADNVPSRRDGDLMYGCGTSDMKSGLALMLHAAATIERPTSDLTLVCYDCEEIDAARNGLKRIAETRREWLDGDLALVLEPTNASIEAGCQGSIRAMIRSHGKRSHAARSWLGVNAIHALGEALGRLRAYEPRTVPIDGCVYREGLNAVRISGGVAGNVIPDFCEFMVNYRFAPDLTTDEAIAHLQKVFDGFEIEVVDVSPAAPPGLTVPAAQDFVAAIGGTPLAKFGWTDVARFAVLGIPAVNFGPGDPNLAHTRDENVDVRKITASAEALRRYLTQ